MSVIKANQHQVGSNVTTSKNIVFTTDVSTGDLVINKGVYDGTLTEISRIMNAGGGAQYVPAGTGAVATTVQAKLRESVSVKDFGAVGDGVTNDRIAIKTAVAALQAAGGGALIFPAGNYLISGIEGTYNLPELAANIQWSTAAYDVQLYFSGLSNIEFCFDGSRLVSNKTDGGITLVLDGCNNIVFDNLRMTGATVMSGSTATTNGTNAVALLSTTQNSSNITFTNPKIDAHYTSIDIDGNPASSYRVSNVVIDGAADFRNGYYGVVCRGNGVNVCVENAYSYRQNRPLFIYDTQDVYIKMVCDDMNGGFQSIVKAYTQNTFNISVDMSVRNRANTQPCLEIQSQHNPALQATPAYVKGLKIRYTDYNSVAGGSSVRFSYYQDSTNTSTSNQLLFTDIDIDGNAVGTFTSDVTLTAIANYAVLRMSNFAPSNGFAIYTGSSGFVPSRVLTWTPTDNSGAALSLTVAACRYTIDQTVAGSFSITYPTTASTASASITGLPVKVNSTGTSAQGVFISYTDCGLPLLGLLGSNSTNMNFYKNTGAAVQNVELSGKTVRGSFAYFA